jgi:Arc/MetJ-type ribon-helix-helix transcriptional regulator
METLNINLPDAMHEFVRSKVGPGRPKDVSAYVCNC